MSREYELELESLGEFEEELESGLQTEWEIGSHGEMEGAHEGEEFLGTIARGIGSLLGESGLGEYEEEFEAPLHEAEWEAGSYEGALPEYEWESELETALQEAGLHEGGMQEFEYETSEYEMQGEAFFRRLVRGVGRFVRRAAPVLRRVARIAAPIVGTAIGGPLGSVIGRVASSVLGESALGEFEEEWETALHEAPLHENEAEFEWETGLHEGGLGEFESEAEIGAHELESELGAHEMIHEALGEQEIMHEMAHELAAHEALAEYMAAVASRAASEAEAEAMVGAAVSLLITPAERAELRAVMPHLVRGMAMLTRILRRNRYTRQAIRVVPTIVRSSVATLRNQRSLGRRATRGLAARVVATQTRRALDNPRICTHAIIRNVRATRNVAQRGLRTVGPAAGYRPARRTSYRPAPARTAMRRRAY